MSTLVFGAVGAVVGGVIGFYAGNPVLGAQLGFMLGSGIGALVDPPKVQGPKLHDLKLQDSSYGKTIPFVWGRGRMAGNVIDQTDLTPHGSSDSGKGGPEVEATSYTASLDILLCARTPANSQAIQGIAQIFADGAEIWSEQSGEPIPCTVYYGSADQAVDPTFEAIHGVGNVPAYNNYAHVVFTDHDMTPYGNRIPQFEFVVYTKAGTFPWRVSTFEVDDGLSILSDAAIYEEGVINVGWGWPARYEAQYGLDGTIITPIHEVAGGAFGTRTWHNILQFNDGFFYDANGDIIPAYSYSDAVGLFPDTNLSVALAADIAADEFIIVPSSSPLLSSYLVRVDGFGSMIQLGTTNHPKEEANGGHGVSGGTTTYKVYLNDRNDLPTNLWLRELDVVVSYGGAMSITLSRTWDMAAEYAASAIFNGASFAVYMNRAGRLVLACDRGNVGFKQVACFYLNDDLTTTYIGAVNYGTYGPTHPVTLLGAGPYLLTGDGVISLEPPGETVLLSEIAGDLSKDFIDGTDIVAHNVAELTDEVRWFAVANVMTRRNALGTLRPAFFFDAVESDDEVVFRKRGSSSIATIPDDDLCARSDGEEAGDPLRTIRKKEQGLPRVVTMTYYDVDTDYQTGAQSSPRVTTLSESEVIIDVPIGFTSAEALQKCWSVQCAEWVERETFVWSLTRKWARLEPCDVINVRGRVIRITARTEKPDGVIDFEGVLDAPSIYTQNAESSIGGFVPQPVQSASVLTELVLMDIPILSQQHAPFGFYAAMGREMAGRWSGAALYKSLDGGTNYTAIATTSTRAVIGETATSVVGSPSASGALSAYGGGETVEEAEICVVLHDEDATLASITATALQNGGGWCAISRGHSVGSPTVLEWELLGIRDWTLIAPKTYIGQGFKRGRKNTLTTNHADGDIFVLLSSVINVDAPVGELNLSLKYKAVTFGKTLGTAEAQDFINTGQSTDSFYGEEIIHLPPFGGASPGSPSVGGSQGVVPAPAAGDCEAGKYLSACGIWSVPAGGGGGGDVAVYDSGLLIISAASILNFTGNVVATDAGGGQATIDIPAAAPAPPLDAAFVMVAHGSPMSAPNGRVLIAGNNATVTDNGPGGTIEVACTVSAGGREQSQEFTSDGVFTVPDGVGLIHVTMIGAGGGGSSRDAAAQGGSGGGAGELVIDLPIVVTPSVGSPGTTYSVTVGAAGAGAIGTAADVAGGDGGNTSFGGLFSVLGGRGGASTGVGGAGGGSSPGAGGAAGNPGAIGVLGTVESTCHFGGSGGSGGGSTTASAGGAGRPGPGYSAGAAGGAAAGSQAGGGAGAGASWGLGGAGGAGGAVGEDAPAGSYGAGGGGAGGKASPGVDGGDGMSGYCLVSWIS